MDDLEMKLECLKLAIEATRGGDVQNTVEAARRFHEWLLSVRTQSDGCDAFRIGIENPVATGGIGGRGS